MHALTFGFVLYALYLIYAFKKSKSPKVGICPSNLLLLLSALFLNCINVYFINSRMILALVLIFGAYSIFSTFLSDFHRRKAFWLTCFFALMLPVKEYVQIFIGTPIRFFSAEVIADFFKLIGVKTVTESSVLIFENNLANIDYPCSGTATILVLCIFICAAAFLLNLKPTFKLFVASLFCLILSVFLNIARIIILIYGIEIIGAQDFTDKIHILLGVVNFVIICTIFAYFAHKFDNSFEKNRVVLKNKIGYFAMFLLTCFFAISFFNFQKNTESPNLFTVKRNEQYQNLALSAIEQKFFKQTGAAVEKYMMPNSIIILKITSSSWRSHHNPINCIKGQGLEVVSQNTVKIDECFVKHVKLKTGEAYYFFSDGDIVTDDYYKRAFQGVFSSKKKWTLCIISSGNTISEDVVRSELKNQHSNYN